MYGRREGKGGAPPPAHRGSRDIHKEMMEEALESRAGKGRSKEDFGHFFEDVPKGYLSQVCAVAMDMKNADLLDDPEQKRRLKAEAKEEKAAVFPTEKTPLDIADQRSHVQSFCKRTNCDAQPIPGFKQIFVF